jgi:PLP dependent protein
MQQEQIAAHIAEVRARIAHAAERAGRDPAEVTLVAVSKTQPIELVQMAYRAGISDFGENRVQEALPKIDVLHPADLRWHLIGHLQSNKAGKASRVFDCIHSIDSLHLARVLNRNRLEHIQNTSVHLDRLPVLLQVNVTGEESKEGVAVAEAPLLARQIAALPSLEIQGLMTIAPLVKDPEEARPAFRALRELRERLRDELPEYSWRHLSMGMTGDYQVAIEEGATIVRIGRAIFGERANKQKTTLPVS